MPPAREARSPKYIHIFCHGLFKIIHFLFLTVSQCYYYSFRFLNYVYRLNVAILTIILKGQSSIVFCTNPTT